MQRIYEIVKHKDAEIGISAENMANVPRKMQECGKKNRGSICAHFGPKRWRVKQGVYMQQRFPAQKLSES